MDTVETVGQGLTFVTDEETGRSYPIPSGGSDGDVSISDGGEGTVQGAEATPPSNEGSDASGFLEPYLSELPEDQREVVRPVMEKFRKEQDAKVNQRFEQLREESRVPTMIHQALIQDPLTTLNWIADRIQQEQGLDVRQELLSRWQQGQQEAQVQSLEGQGQEQEPKALTAEDIDQILEEREQQRQQSELQQQQQQAQYQEQQKTLNSWIDNAAKSHSLPLDDSNGEDPLRAVIIMSANKLHESGVAKGQAAVEMATEAIAQRFGRSTKPPGQDAAKVAEGGSAPPSKPIDVSDKSQRIARMEELFGAASKS